MFRGGKVLDFEEHLVEELGRDKVEELKQRRHLVVKLDHVWYLEKIQYYKDKIEELNG